MAFARPRELAAHRARHRQQGSDRCALADGAPGAEHMLGDRGLYTRVLELRQRLSDADAATVPQLRNHQSRRDRGGLIEYLRRRRLRLAAMSRVVAGPSQSNEQVYLRFRARKAVTLEQMTETGHERRLVELPDGVAGATLKRLGDRRRDRILDRREIVVGKQPRRRHARDEELDRFPQRLHASQRVAFGRCPPTCRKSQPVGGRKPGRKRAEDRVGWVDGKHRCADLHCGRPQPASLGKEAADGDEIATGRQGSPAVSVERLRLPIGELCEPVAEADREPVNCQVDRVKSGALGGEPKPLGMDADRVRVGVAELRFAEAERDKACAAVRGGHERYASGVGSSVVTPWSGAMTSNVSIGRSSRPSMTS